jgi:hypothetical protein
VHLVGLRDGTLLNRLATDDSGQALRPLVLGNTLLVVTQRGGLYAFAAQ